MVGGCRRGRVSARDRGWGEGMGGGGRIGGGVIAIRTNKGSCAAVLERGGGRQGE